MKTRQKVLIAIILSVMALTIIGMTIGLVLVAQNASVNNSMQVSFNANNVDAKIVASGMNYANFTATGSDGEVIAITGNTGDSATVVFKATMDEATDGVGFGEARLYSAGRAVYTFAVTNTANVSNTRVLKVLATVTKVNDAGENVALSDDDNMTILIGSSEVTATAVSADSNLYYVEIGPGQASGNIVVVAKVTDPHQDVNNFLLGLQLDFGYDIEDPGAFDWGDATGEIIMGVVNKSNVSSVITPVTVMGLPISSDCKYDSSTDGTMLVFSYTADRYNGSTCLEYTVTGDAANYTVSVELPDGTKVEKTAYFDGSVFQDGENNNLNWFTIYGAEGGDYSIMFSMAANSFDETYLVSGIKILITIESAS